MRRPRRTLNAVRKQSNSDSAPTVRDIAARAGVSVGTVSRALKGQAGLTEETRQQVLSVAAGLGYDHSKLRPVKVRRLGFLLHESHSGPASNPFYFPVLHGVETACRNSAVAFTYSSVGARGEVEQLITLLEVDGLICAGYWEPDLLAEIIRAGKPVVLVDHDAPGLPAVNTDNVSGAYQATQHLIAIGRSRVAMLTGPEEHYSIQQREEGYRQALLERRAHTGRWSNGAPERGHRRGESRGGHPTSGPDAPSRRRLRLQ